MKVFSHNFNPHSNSGPNKFSKQLFNCLTKKGLISLTDNQEDADVEFCLIQQQAYKVKPMLLRLDGIYFNSDQNYNKQNQTIRYSYQNADAVVFQSNFNKTLTEKWFGVHRNSFVIHNAADLSLIQAANTRYWDRVLDPNLEVWSCASSWRPHKRLKENVEYFLSFAPKDALFAIAGGLHMDEAKELLSMDKRIHVLGELDYMSLLSLYKRSSTFVHLAFLDHCPNVVVDAQAAGCHVICSSTGGTSEIVSNGTMLMEAEWDFMPLKLYSPPKIDYNKSLQILPGKNTSMKKNIVECANSYYNVFKQIEVKS